MTNIVNRLLGHLEWHFRRVRRNFEALRPDPTLLRLRLHNKFYTKSIIDINGPVVSLTSYGKRIESVFLTIESIGEGKTKPARIILWLDDPNILSSPPITLRRLVKRGLEIKPTENYRSHKKYLPYVLSCDFFEKPLVTADDDVIYPSTWLQDLFLAYNNNNKVINCFRARTIYLENGDLSPFINWPFCNSTSASFRHFSEGVAGVIFPPEYLSALKKAGFGFIATCPRHDDVWLNVMALRNGYPVRQIGNKPADFELLPDTQEDGLWVTNLGPGGDKQIRETYTVADIKLMELEPYADEPSQSR